MVGRFSHRDCFPTVSWAGIQFKPTSTFTEPEGLLVKEPQEAGVGHGVPVADSSPQFGSCPYSATVSALPPYATLVDSRDGGLPRPACSPPNEETEAGETSARDHTACG